MAKKTTTPAGSKPAKSKTVARSPWRKLDEEIRKLEERQATRAVDRAIRWARLLDQLETLLDRADDLFTHGVPVDFDSVARVHAEMHDGIADPANRPTLGDVRKMESDDATYALYELLQLAENWLPMIGDEHKVGDSRAIADVRLRLEGKSPLDASSTPAEAIALGITCVRMLLDGDLLRAKSFGRVPSEDDLDVLERLRDKAKTAKELAVEIAGRGNEHDVVYQQHVSSSVSLATGTANVVAVSCENSGSSSGSSRHTKPRKTACSGEKPSTNTASTDDSQSTSRREDTGRFAKQRASVLLFPITRAISSAG